MKKGFDSFSPRQKMLKEDFEIYRYRDSYLSEVALHHHDFYEMYLFLSGKVDYIVESRRYALKPGDILLISPLELHQPVIEPFGKPYERVVLWVSKACLNALSGKDCDLSACFSGTNNLLRLDAVSLKRLEDLLDDLMEETGSDSFGSAVCARAILSRVLVEVNRRKLELPPAPDLPGQSSAIIAEVLGYINENFASDISLDSLSAHFFVSKYHLSREFKRWVGTSVYRYVIQKRLIIAKQMMLSGMNPTDVYSGCGFGDYANFYRAFKAEYGISPKEFIQTSQNREK